MKKFSNKFKYFIGAIVSITFLYLALKDIDFQELRFYFSIDYMDMVLLIIIINVVLRVIIALRWHRMLNIFPSNKFRTTFNYTNIGYFANNILPARLGDIIKSYMLAKKAKYNKTQVFTSVIIERIFDLIGLSVLFLIASFRYDIPKEILRGGMIFIIILFISTLIILLMLKKKDKLKLQLENITKYKLINFLKEKLDSVFYYLHNYLNLKDLSYIIISTGLIWFLYVFTGYIIIERLNGIMSWDASMLSLIFIGVSFILPSTPGNIGVQQFACVLAFGILGMDKAQAVAYSFYYQIPVIVISIILGFISIYYEGFSIKSISRISKETSSTELNEIG